jgi:hypothetical protein
MKWGNVNTIGRSVIPDTEKTGDKEAKPSLFPKVVLAYQLTHNHDETDLDWNDYAV